jgi:hypothetical protein
MTRQTLSDEPSDFGGRHAPTFRRPDLPPGTADCLRCGQVLDLETFLTTRCRGRLAPELVRTLTRLNEEGR